MVSHVLLSIPSPSENRRAGRHRRAAARVAGWLAGLLLCACGPEELSWEAPLPERASKVFAAQPQAEAGVRAALDHYFGRPGDVRTPDVPALAAERIHPGQPGAGRLADDEGVLDALRIDNGVRFEALLTALDAGETPAEWPAELAHLEALFAEGSSVDLPATIQRWTPDLDHASSVYGRQCIGCHGRAGRGDGPSSGMLNPKPRDFASGDFVHFRRDQRQRPSQLELMQVIHTGAPGTGMASFKRLGSAEISALSDLVRWFGARGEFTERALDRAARGESLELADLEAEADQ
ncbi:MAG: c-type cytochrome [Planctomycetota bacterium]|jgi:mono/diheme cytochrome c family protein